jgi:hypothetical protein
MIFITPSPVTVGVTNSQSGKPHSSEGMVTPLIGKISLGLKTALDLPMKL